VKYHKRLACDRLISLAAASAPLFVNLDYEFAGCIGVASVHSGSIEWQGDVALAVNRDHSAGTAEFGHFIKNRLRSLLELHSPIFHQGRNIVPDGCANKILPITRSGDRTRRIVRVGACANDW